VKDRLVAAWDGFFFTPQSMVAMGLCRVATGLVTLYCLLLMLPFVDLFFTDAGWITAWEHLGSVFRPDPTLFLLIGSSPAVVWAVWVAAIGLAVSLTAGYRTKPTAILLYILLLSIHERDTFLINGGDLVIRTMVFWLALMPYGGGAVLSVDAWLRERAEPDAAPLEAWPWVQRMVQIQIVVLYLITFSWKMKFPRWHDGSAIHEAMGAVEFIPPGMELMLNYPTVTAGLTAVVGLSQALLPLCLIFRRTRGIAFLLGLCLHGWIMVFMRIPVFGLIMWASYLAFLDEDQARRVVGWLRRLGVPTPGT
jgi:hypothetical protein